MQRNNVGISLGLFVFFALSTAANAQTGFFHWESPHISPLALTPDNNRLLAVNTADNRLEIFDVTSGTPIWTRSISVGLDPVSVRPRNNAEVWVVNHVSDSISVIDLLTNRVVRTIATADEPTDVVFAGTPQRAFVSVSQRNQIMVFDPANPGAAPTTIAIEGEEPRALAVSADGATVYAAIFESGNATGAIRQQDVSNATGPYAGQNPPPNSGNVFSPPLTAGLPPAPPVAQIVRRNTGGQWLDGNGRNWSSFVSWNLHDHDVAMINASSLAVTYASGIMTTVMAIGVRPDGAVTVVGTEARNEIRFEPNVQSIFIRVMLGSFNPASPTAVATNDLNPHLTYAVRSIPQSQRDLSIGDPRAIVWNADGTRGYIAGMGSNNLIVIDQAGSRVTQIGVGQGPTGLAMSSDGSRLFVMNKFDASISTVSTASNGELSRVSFFDPTPAAVKAGRPMLYDTHRTSGLGQIACASCHIDGRTDFLAWDLGDPSGQMKTFNQSCRTPNCRNWHPMKGPMITQSLQNIVGVEPFHWRGDRENLAAFGPAFTGLQGADAVPSPLEMSDFEDFIATIHYPPSPNRNIDGTMPATFPTTGGGNGNPNNGRNLYLTLPVLGGNTTCNACHSLPEGTSQQIDDPNLPLAPQPLKIVQLRGMWERDGWRRGSANNNKGFGFNHHSEFDTLNALLNAGFNFGGPAQAPQNRRDVEAFLMCFDTDTHAGVGQQLTFDGANNANATLVARLTTFVTLADSGVVAMIAKGRVAGIDRGYVYTGANVMQSDISTETTSPTALRTGAAAGNEITFTLVPAGTQLRQGIDRDSDGYFDRDEIDNCGDPANASIGPVMRGDLNADGNRNAADIPPMVAALLSPGTATAQQRCAGDLNRDGSLDGQDIATFTQCVIGGTCP